MNTILEIGSDFLPINTTVFFNTSVSESTGSTTYTITKWVAFLAMIWALEKLSKLQHFLRVSLILNKSEKF